MIFEISNYLNNLDETQFTLNLENFSNILLLSKIKLKVYLKYFYILISLERNNKLYVTIKR